VARHQAFIKLPDVLSHEQTFAKRKTVPYTPQQARAHSSRARCAPLFR
jgi:hypothetical protein